MPVRITDTIYKIQANSNCYVLLPHGDIDEPLVIDTGDRKYHGKVRGEITTLISPKQVKTVILTHFHADHIGNADLFPNAGFYAGEQEISNFREDAVSTILDEGIAELFQKHAAARLRHIPLPMFKGLKVFTTPSHSSGAICLYYEKEKILFSGDTLFDKGRLGRTDLPTSVPEHTEETMRLVNGLGYRTLCPGHDY